MAWYWWVLVYIAFIVAFVWGWSRFMGNLRADDAEVRRALGLPPEDDE